MLFGDTHYLLTAVMFRNQIYVHTYLCSYMSISLQILYSLVELVHNQKQHIEAHTYIVDSFILEQLYYSSVIRLTSYIATSTLIIYTLAM